jgi:aryl-alcohol dehydrogenase-like predicted oxidoreductase
MNGYCNYKGIGIIPYCPLSNGYLTRPLDSPLTHRQEVRKGHPLERKLSDNEKEIIKRVEALAKKKNMTMAHVALAWAQAKSTSPIVGLNKVCDGSLLLRVYKMLIYDHCRLKE